MTACISLVKIAALDLGVNAISNTRYNADQNSSNSIQGIMMSLKSVNPSWVKLIKIISPIVMVVALGMDGTIAYHWQQGLMVPQAYKALGAIGSVALFAHTVEGMVAAIMARRQGLNPLRYALYTFFVGTVAFLDLVETEG